MRLRWTLIDQLKEKILWTWPGTSEWVSKTNLSDVGGWVEGMNSHQSECDRKCPGFLPLPWQPTDHPIPVICPSMSPQWETWHPFTCCRGSVCNVQTCALTKTHRSYRCLFIQLCNDWTVWLQQDKQDHTTINYFIIINRCLLFTKLSLAKASHLEMYPFS